MRIPTKHSFTTDNTDSIRINPSRLKQSELPLGGVRIRVNRATRRAIGLATADPWSKFRGFGVNSFCSP